MEDSVGFLPLSSVAGRALVARARAFAERAHGSIGQERKGTGVPYHVHPDEVAGLVAEFFDDAEAVAAAHLHDVVEDVRAVTHDGIGAEFTPRVGVLVREVTDVSKLSDGNRRARKAIDRAHAAAAGFVGKSIKLADILCNARDFLAEIERTGVDGFHPVWFAEKRLVLEALGDGHQALFALASEAVESFFVRCVEDARPRSGG